MKTKNHLKVTGIAVIFGISYLGINITTRTQRIANSDVKIALVTIGSQAQAYCNEARYKNETNNGKCSGEASFPETRCNASSSGSACVIE